MAKVILLEPDRQLAKKIKEYFQNKGYDLRYFADPQAAVTAADHSLPDVIILNLFLATHSGIEFLYELRSYPEWSSIPVIATSNLPSEELENYNVALEELKVAAYLPIQTSALSDLLATVQTALQPQLA